MPETSEYMRSPLSRWTSVPPRRRSFVNPRIKLAKKTLQNAQETAVAPDNTTSSEDDEILNSMTANKAAVCRCRIG